jgi:hypothetical protein
MYQLTGEGWRGWGGWGGEEDIGLERWGRFNPCRHTDFPPYQHKVVLISLSIWTTVEQTGGVGVSENPAKSLFGTEYRRPMGMG